VSEFFVKLPRGVDQAGGDTAANMFESGSNVEAERAPFLVDRAMECGQARAEGPDQTGQIAAPLRVSGVGTRERLGDQDRMPLKLLYDNDDGHREVGGGPDHSFRFAHQGGAAVG
jgi:hypothetical protein